MPRAALSAKRHEFDPMSPLPFEEMWQDFLAKKTRLLQPIIAPEFQHHLRAARGVVLFELFDALSGRAGDGTNFVERGIGNSASGGFAPAFLHGLGDWLKFIAREPGALEARVRRAFDVLHFV